jgi:hypothetical protein
MSDIEDRLDRLESLVDSQQNGIEGIDTVGCDSMKIFATPGWRIPSRTYSRQYEHLRANDERLRDYKAGPGSRINSVRSHSSLDTATERGDADDD